MKKFLYYLFGILSCITGIMFIYLIFTPSKIESVGTLMTLFFECAFCTVLFIMLEPRKRETEAQKKYDDAIQAKGLGIIILLAIVGGFLVII